MTSQPEDITTGIGMSAAEAAAYVDQLTASTQSPSEKVLAVSF